MFKKILILDQYVLGIFQCISNMAIQISVDRIYLIRICYLFINSIISLDIIYQDKIFIGGAIDKLIVFKGCIILLLIVSYLVAARICNRREQLWGKNTVRKSMKKYERLVFILRINYLGIGSAIGIFSGISIVACYLCVFFVTNACAYYFLSCEPGTTNRLNQKNNMVAA